MKSALLHLSRAGAGVLSAALVGRFGIPVLAGLGFLIVLGIVMVCWIVNSKDRSTNLSRILFARRGDPRCLDPDPIGHATQAKSRTPQLVGSGRRRASSRPQRP